MKFTKEQTDFLKRELNITIKPDAEANLSKDEWFDIKDRVFMIEADEARPDGELNDRCRIAVEIGDKHYDN